MQKQAGRLRGVLDRLRNYDIDLVIGISVLSLLPFLYIHSQHSNMSTPTSGKYSVRPIVRFAEAAAQCSKEVRQPLDIAQQATSLNIKDQC